MPYHNDKSKLYYDFNNDFLNQYSYCRHVTMSINKLIIIIPFLQNCWNIVAYELLVMCTIIVKSIVEKDIKTCKAEIHNLYIEMKNVDWVWHMFQFSTFYDFCTFTIICAIKIRIAVSDKNLANKLILKLFILYSNKDIKRDY